MNVYVNVPLVGAVEHEFAEFTTEREAKVRVTARAWKGNMRMAKVTHVGRVGLDQSTDENNATRLISAARDKWAKPLWTASILVIGCCMLAHPAMAQSTPDDNQSEEAAPASTEQSRQA